MNIIIAVVLFALGLVAWKQPEKMGNLSFKQSFWTLMVGLLGLGVSDSSHLAAVAIGDTGVIGVGAVGLGVGWIALIYSVISFFKMLSED